MHVDKHPRLRVDDARDIRLILSTRLRANHYTPSLPRCTPGEVRGSEETFGYDLA
jgi:hypothetical protein